MADTFYRENSFTIVGTLLDAQIKYGNKKSDGAGYISVEALVGAEINGIHCEYPVRFYSNQLKADKTPNKLYESYSKMGSLVGKKVQIDGSLRENRFFSTKTKQLASATQLSGNFVKGVVVTEPDVARFILGGFIVTTLTEKKNKENEIYRYDLGLAQANYAGDKVSLFTLHVDPARTDVVNSIQKLYQAGDTVQFSGSLIFKVEQVTVQDDNAAFGTPVTRTYTNKQNNYFIESGSTVITDNRQYGRPIINSLVNSYKAEGKELEANAANSAAAGDNTEVPASKTISARQASLI